MHMKIVTKCYSCGKETAIAFPRHVKTVVDFEMEKKAIFYHKCERCRKNNKTTVKQISAKKDYFGFFKKIAGIYAVVLIFVWATDYYPALGLFIFIPLLWSDEKDRVREFNKSLDKMEKRKANFRP